MIFACVSHVNVLQTVAVSCVTLYCSHENAYSRPNLLCDCRYLGGSRGSRPEPHFFAFVEDSHWAGARESAAHGRVSGEHPDQPGPEVCCDSRGWLRDN